MVKAYYNEIDPKAAAWLRELIKNGLIADGEVDERSITEVRADDLVGFAQCHFFAGIGGWSYALRLAGIPDEYPIWTASLPCQPFSAAGKQLGKDDERHLLPHYLELVKQCRPNLQIGEQVEGAIRHGWLDDLQTTMEAEGYAVGYCVLGAHSVGSFHQRQRLYWVADSKNRNRRSESQLSSSYAAESRNKSGGVCEFSRLAHAGSKGLSEQQRESIKSKRFAETSSISYSWALPEWIYCRDNKYRPIKRGLKPTIPSIKSSTFKVVDGIPRGMVRSGDTSQPINANETQEARVMRLKGYGNAIVPQVASEFVQAFYEVVNENHDPD